jgi:hypothetical protein
MVSGVVVCIRDRRGFVDCALQNISLEKGETWKEKATQPNCNCYEQKTGLRAAVW